MSCILCRSNLTVFNPGYSCIECQSSICEICNFITSEFYERMSGTRCIKCLKMTNYDADPNLVLSKPCCVHESEKLAFYCENHKLFYCEKCESHIKCRSQKKIDINLERGLIDEDNSINEEFIKNMFEDMEKKFMETKKFFKDRIAKIKEELKSFKDQFKVYLEQLHRIKERLDCLSRSKTVCKFILHSAAFELVYGFESYRISAAEQLQNSLVEMQDDSIRPTTSLKLPSDSDEVFIDECFFYSPRELTETNEVTFKCVSERFEIFTIESISFGRPIFNHASGTIKNLEVIHQQSPNNMSVYQKQDIKISNDSQLPLVSIKLDMKEKKISLLKNEVYLIKYEYSGCDLFFSKKNNIIKTEFLEAYTDPVSYNSKIFGIKLASFS